MPIYSFDSGLQLFDCARRTCRVVELLSQHGVPTQTGKFGEHMLVEIHNDGPVTIWLER